MEELDNGEIKKIAYNCRKATFLIEKKQQTEITLREKLELKIHLAGCSVCRVFEQQSAVINQMVKELFQPKHDDNINLDVDFKRKLEEQIRLRLNKRP